MPQGRHYTDILHVDVYTTYGGKIFTALGTKYLKSSFAKADNNLINCLFGQLYIGMEEHSSINFRMSKIQQKHYIFLYFNIMYYIFLLWP